MGWILECAFLQGPHFPQGIMIRRNIEIIYSQLSFDRESTWSLVLIFSVKSTGIQSKYSFVNTLSKRKQIRTLAKSKSWYFYVHFRLTCSLPMQRNADVSVCIVFFFSTLRISFATSFFPLHFSDDLYLYGSAARLAAHTESCKPQISLEISIRKTTGIHANNFSNFSICAPAAMNLSS